MMKRFLVVAATASVLSACGTMMPAKPVDIVETAKNAGSFTILTKAVADAGLTDTLKGPGPFTVFAPTDAAFNALPKDQLSKLTADKAQLAALLTYHVVPGKVMAKDVSNTAAKTVNGANANLSRSGNLVGYEDALVTKADIEATNGVIHVIDKVVLPPAPARR
jgi:uncharacterized surface protein with fasciclin (FAS1) repeats